MRGCGEMIQRQKILGQNGRAVSQEWHSRYMCVPPLRMCAQGAQDSRVHFPDVSGDEVIGARLERERV